MTPVFTLNQFVSCFPSIPVAAAKTHYEIVSQELTHYGVTNKAEIAMLFAQTGHESGDLRRTRESLDYTTPALMRVFPTHPLAWPYGRTASRPANQEAIANRVYNNRMGNGSIASGDGWKYRGAGLIQLTGLDNFRLYGQQIGVDLVNHPEYAEQVRSGWKIALQFFKNRALRYPSRNGDVVSVTTAINGGNNVLTRLRAKSNGLQERKDRYARNLRVLGG